KKGGGRGKGGRRAGGARRDTAQPGPADPAARQRLVHEELRYAQKEQPGESAPVRGTAKHDIPDGGRGGEGTKLGKAAQRDPGGVKNAQQGREALQLTELG